MFHHSSKLQYQVRVDRPDPQFAKYFHQANGGVEGEIRVAMQYFFQAMGGRGDAKYRDMLIMTAIEELGGWEQALPVPNSTPHGPRGDRTFLLRPEHVAG
ncbi:manganese catalase family protein [Paracoccus sediminilitoris]|uniref:manganese catalase family protein n=1 Tax=Paracoccus sediminilitoris TaxID=2202419 RepID=UPI001F1D282B|nr:manganese catalase family protein [Paracoccus sediminilitoris]